MTLDRVVDSLADRLQEDGEGVSAVAMQAAAGADPSLDDRVFDTLEETLMEGMGEASEKSAEALASYTVTEDVDAEEVFDVFETALESEDEDVRSAALHGVKKASKLNPDLCVEDFGLED